MKITHYLYIAFVIEEDGVKIAIDPGQNLWLFKLDLLTSLSSKMGPIRTVFCLDTLLFLQHDSLGFNDFESRECMAGMV